MIYRLQPIVRHIAGRDSVNLRRSLLHAIRTNGIAKKTIQYIKYNAAARGCSPDNPFMLTDTLQYVRLEHDIMCYIMDYNPARGEWIRFVRHGQTQRNDKIIDWLEYVVCTDIDSDHPETHFERYYFDITQCLNL